MSGWWREVRAFLADIKLEHSVFALPFALIGALLACRIDHGGGGRALPWPTPAELAWLLVAMVGARSAAMGFNRVVDRETDARNPRTAARPLAAGGASPGGYWALIGLGVLALWVAAGQLSPLAQHLSPLALLVLFGYSLTKRYTAACHWILGLALGLSPLAAWVALCGTIPTIAAPYWLSLAVICWVAGFDILYATLDLAFDRAEGLYSIPAVLGLEPALRVARWSHAACALGLLLFGFSAPGLGWGYALALSGALGLLAYQHALVRPDDLRRVNEAFFTVNAVLGLILLAGVSFDWLVPR